MKYYKKGAVRTEQISYYRQAVNAYQVSQRVPEALEDNYNRT